MISELLKAIDFLCSSYTALFTYSPSQDDELALIQGDHYCVVEKHLDGWYKGFHMRSRQTGVFPGNYVKPKRYLMLRVFLE